MQITVQVTPESDRALRVRLDNAQKGTARGLTSGIKAATIFVASYIKRELLSGQIVMRRSGNLSRAIFTRMESDTVGVIGVGPEAPYARFVNDGTRPHLIQGNPFLAFTPGADAIRNSAFASLGRGGYIAPGLTGTVTANASRIRSAIAANRIVVRFVHHPGTAPRRFMETGLAASASNVRDIINERVRRGMKGEQA